jgi:hypothetical protein
VQLRLLWELLYVPVESTYEELSVSPEELL